MIINWERTKSIKNVEFIEINIIGDGRINSPELICDEIIEKLNSKNI